MNIMGTALTAAARGRLEQLLTKQSSENISEALKLSRRQDLSFAPLLKNCPKFHQKMQKTNFTACFFVHRSLLSSPTHCCKHFYLSFLQLSHLNNFPEVSAPLQCPHCMAVFQTGIPGMVTPWVLPWPHSLLLELLVLLYISSELQILRGAQGSCQVS